MPRFIDMTDAQKAQAWKRHIAAGGAGSHAAALAAAQREVAKGEALVLAKPSLLHRSYLRSAKEHLARVQADIH